MPHYEIDPDKQNGNGCATCCCEAATAMPGITEKWLLDYSGWAVPIGGKGLSQTDFVLEKLYDAPRRIEAAGTVQNTPLNTPLNFAVSGLVTGNPDALTLTYALLPFNTFEHGTATIDANTGALVYTPINGYVGYDRAFVAITPESSTPIVVEIAVAVNPVSGNLPAPKLTPDLSVPADRVQKLRGAWASITFALVVSPAASVGDIWRLSVKQATLDCDCQPYTHVSCYDVTIGKC